MKRFLLFSILVLICSVHIYGQKSNRKLYYSSIVLEKTFMLNQWLDNTSARDPLEGFSRFDIGYRFDIAIYDYLGIWGSFSIGDFKKAKPIPSYFDFCKEINLDNYYVKDLKKKEGKSSGVSPKMIAGIFYKHKFEKYIITPSLGIGINGQMVPELKCTLKEKGGNAAYDIDQEWFDSYNRDDNYKNILFLYFHTKAEKRISSKINLSLGVSYYRYLSRPNFRATIVDHYTQELIEDIHEKGKFINSIGITFGVGFW